MTLLHKTIIENKFRFIICLLCFWLLIKIYPVFGQKTVLQKENHLFGKPEITWVDSVGPNYSLYYSSVFYKGNKTKVFAYYSLPDTFTGKIPAMVLVHGGGGTAFKNWTKQWAEYGYAAISMDLNGLNKKGDTIGCLRNEVEFNLEKSEVKDSWYYHSIAAIIKSISFLHTQSEVDTNRIGIVGISWGGYHTASVVGLDTRLSAGVIVYGCGFLHQNSVWLREGNKFSKTYIKELDPVNFLPYSKIPTLWLNNNTDHFFPLNSHQSSRKLTAGKSFALIPDNYQHGYETPWKTENIRKFIDSFLKEDGSWPIVLSSGIVESSIWAKIKNTDYLMAAKVIYTREDNWMRMSTRKEGDDVWITQDAVIETDSVYAQIPDGAVAAYLHITQTDKKEISTDYFNLDSKK